MKHSELIRHAKKFLWDGKKPSIQYWHHIYVCHCLAEVKKRASESDAKKIDQIEKRIQKAIGSFTVFGKPMARSVEDWLNERGFPADSIGRQWKQDYRSRWMDAMIKEYEEQGK